MNAISSRCLCISRQLLVYSCHWTFKQVKKWNNFFSHNQNVDSVEKLQFSLRFMFVSYHFICQTFITAFVINLITKINLILHSQLRVLLLSQMCPYCPTALLPMHSRTGDLVRISGTILLSNAPVFVPVFVYFLPIIRISEFQNSLFMVIFQGILKRNISNISNWANIVIKLCCLYSDKFSGKQQVEEYF